MGGLSIYSKQFKLNVSYWIIANVVTTRFLNVFSYADSKARNNIACTIVRQMLCACVACAQTIQLYIPTICVSVLHIGTANPLSCSLQKSSSRKQQLRYCVRVRTISKTIIIIELGECVVAILHICQI